MDTPPPELQNEPKGQPRFKAWLAPLIVASLACVTTALALYLFLPGPPAPPESDANATAHGQYEEHPTDELETFVRRTDQALLLALSRLHVDTDELELLDVQRRSSADRDYHFQVIRIHLNGAAAPFQASLADLLRQAVPLAELNALSASEWTIHIDGVLTHRLVLVEPETKYPSVPGPKMVIVIDDLGENMRVARGLAGLSQPVTFSIWPSSTHSVAVQRLAKTHGLETLVHLPMEPKGYPKFNPGPNALFTSMSADKIRSVTATSLDKVPGAVGVNNHMGSRFTGYQPGMVAALTQMHNRGLFFLDSRTAPDSVAVPVSKEVGIPLYRRDIFLDNDPTVAAITLQLKKTARIAKRRGWAIAIGHPHPQTVTAIRQWLASNPGVRLVKLSDLRPQ